MHVICVLAYTLSRAPDGDSTCEAVEKESEISGEAQGKVYLLHYAVKSHSALINFAFHFPLLMQCHQIGLGVSHNRGCYNMNTSGRTSNHIINSMECG